MPPNKMGSQSHKHEYIPGTSVGRRSSQIILFPEIDHGGSGTGAMEVHCLIGDEGDHGYKCYPYKLSRLKYAALILLYLLSAGLLWLIFYWRPDWKLKFTHYPCTFIEKVNSVFLIARDGTERVFVVSVKSESSHVKKYAPHLFEEKRPFSPNSGMYQNTYVNEEDNSTISGNNENEMTMCFIHQYKKYIWDEYQQTFIRIDGLDSNVPFQYIHDSASRGLSRIEQAEKKILHGENVIHVEVPPYLKLLLSEVLNPFYVFQVFACIFWMVDEYYAYATAIIIISTISAVVSLINVRRERQSLHDMVERHNTGRVTVLRNVPKSNNIPSSSSAEVVGSDVNTEEIWTKDLVPGDVVVIPPSGMHLSFDAALISGTCIVNESMLTGESVPVTKTPLASSESEMKKIYSVNKQKAHTLFCGTEVIQTRYYRNEIVRALVVRTAFGTAKGDLVHSILFPKPVDLKLLRDAYRFVLIMFCISMIGFVYSCVISIQNDESVRDILFKSIDIITITVPPALPLAMTIGIIYAQVRLKTAKINTVSPQRINVCGQIDVVAFDKTGTLTEDGLDLTEIIPVDHDIFTLPQPASSVSTMDRKHELIRCMATCHSLTLIDAQVSGDPLDIKMFESTGWELIEPKIEDESKYDQLQTTYVRPVGNVDEDMTLSSELLGKNSQSPTRTASEFELGIVRQFPFLSELQRSSVIVKPLNSRPRDMTVYVKGAPETIANLCVSVPPDFSTLLGNYTRQGHRVIALSYKKMSIAWLKAQKVERDMVEKDLNFLGLMILQNKLKPTSSDVIRDLDKAQIRSLMVTGDNLETAMCVAYECKILKPNLPVLIAKTQDNTSGNSSSHSGPILTWQLSDLNNDQRNEYLYLQKVSPLSSSEECNDLETVVSMGDNNSPYKCQIAMTGKDFRVIRKHYPQFIPALAVQGAVFARMSPQQKTELMEELESVDYHVLMCGDGANDCGALKRAHVGLSLSEYDASVAAPFTAHTENGVQPVITLIREGRAALVTSFGMFKFMALYSLIQFTSVLLLYRSRSNLSDYEFLYIDLIIIDVVALTMSRNHAHKFLHWRKPSSSLVSVEMLVSLFFQIFLEFGVQIGTYILVLNQCWFTSPMVTEQSNASGSGELYNTTALLTTTETVESISVDYSHCPPLTNVIDYQFTVDDFPKTYESTTLFFLSSMMYMAVSVSFSRGKPYRTPIYKNFWFVACLLVLTGFTLFLMFGAPPELEDFMEFRHIPELNFLLIIVGISAGHLVLSLLIELITTEHPDFVRRSFSKLNCRKGMGKRYKYITDILTGKNFEKGRYNTVQMQRRDTSGKMEDRFHEQEIHIPSTMIGQFIEPKEIEQNQKELKVDMGKKTAL